MVRSRKKLYIGWFIGKALNWIYIQCACMHAQSCPTLCDPMDRIPPGSSVHGILQARIVEWVAISSSRGSSRPRDRTRISCISCIGGWILYRWAIGKARNLLLLFTDGVKKSLFVQIYLDHLEIHIRKFQFFTLWNCTQGFESCCLKL